MEKMKSLEDLDIGKRIEEYQKESQRRSEALWAHTVMVERRLDNGESLAEITNTWVQSICDEVFSCSLVQFQRELAKWRQHAAGRDFNGPVAWLVSENLTLGRIPKVGRCYGDFTYLQGWKLKENEPTRNWLVFWIPRLAVGSQNLSLEEQIVWREKLRRRYKFPKHHGTSFGSLNLLSGLIMAHNRETKERVPLDGQYAMTDSLRANGSRVVVGHHDGDGLQCVDHDGSRIRCGGFFLLGVEEIED